MTDIAGRPTDAQLEAFRSAELPNPFEGLKHDTLPDNWTKVAVCMENELFAAYNNKTPADRYDDTYRPGNWGIMRRGDASPVLDIIASTEQSATDAEAEPTIGTIALATTVEHVDRKDA